MTRALSTLTPGSAGVAIDPLILQRERLRMVAAMGTRAPISIAVVALLLGAILLRNHPLPRVAAWVTLMILSAAVRGVYCMRLRARLDTVSDLSRPSRWLVAIALLTGGSLGSSIWVFGFDGTQVERVLLTALTLMYCAGASAASGAHPQGLLAMVLAAVSQVVAFWLLVGTSEAHLLVLVLCLTAIIVLTFGMQISRVVTEGVLIRQANIGLLEQIRLERDQAERARKEADAANLAKSRFLAATSHDLRQPLQAVALDASTLKLYVKDGPARKVVNRVNRAIKILDRQFLDLLDLSKLDAGEMPTSETDFPLRQTLAALEGEFLPRFIARGLAFSTAHGDLWVHTDPALLERVIRNLVSNALRYTVNGGARIGSRAVGETVLIEVADTGIGIDAPNVPKIFDEYYQVNNPGRRREYGAGLGLAIVRRFVDLLHLKIEVESKLGAGSVFRVIVPRAQPRAEASHPGEHESPYSPLGLQVWLIEDDDLVAAAMEELLTAWGCTVRVGRTREDLLHMREGAGTWPDAVIFDDMLGEAESGLSVAQSLEGEIGGNRILLVSGNTDAQRLAEISDAGFALLVKPVDPRALQERLRGISRLAD